MSEDPNKIKYLFSTGKDKPNIQFPERQKKNAFIALGSNIDDRFTSILNAVKMLDHLNTTDVVQISGVYESKAWGFENQSDFLNCVVKIRTFLTKLELFVLIKQIEKRLNRQTREKWHEREVDLDILLYESDVIDTSFLSIPHRSMLERDFVIIPLLQIEPEIIHPIHKKKISELWENRDENIKTYILGLHKCQIELKNGEIDKIGKRN